MNKGEKYKVTKSFVLTTESRKNGIEEHVVLKGSIWECVDDFSGLLRGDSSGILNCDSEKSVELLLLPWQYDCMEEIEEVTR